LLPTKTNNPKKKPRPRTSATAPEEKYILRLYVAGATARSRLALRRVYQLCEAEQKDNYELEVIDVYQQPELARNHQIVATPTLVRSLPLPVRRFIGNLSNTSGLFIDSESAGPTLGST
jgi:circadian clock protein KaiB